MISFLLVLLWLACLFGLVCMTAAFSGAAETDSTVAFGVCMLITLLIALLQSACAVTIYRINYVL